MPELLHPGVYVQEVPSAIRPIEGISTATAAFIGVTDKGPLPGHKDPPNGRMAQPVMVTSFTDYLRQFGGHRQDSFLTYAVQAFFDNGGHRLYIVRVADNGTQGAKSATCTVVPPFTSPQTSSWTWSNLLRYDITLVDPVSPTPPPISFDLTVRAVRYGNY